MNHDAIPEPEQLIADAIDSAEEVPDPLAKLVKRTATDPGAPLPEALEALAALKSDNRAAFEALRSLLKKAGCRVTALDDAIAEESGHTGGRGPTQADILIGLAQTAELFHAADGAGFADLDINGHRESWPIRAKGFRRWLARSFFEETGGAPSSEALQSALNVIEAKAHFDAPERQVHIRVGGLDGRLYLDLGDESWRAVEIDATGWRVIDHPPVRFRRASGMKPMPIPMRGGSIETLRSFLNVQTDADFVLVVAWALACLRNRGPYPVIVLSGEQGSVAKSTHAGIPWLRFIRQRVGARVHFWPFDGWNIPAGRSAIAEVYPALWSRGFANEGRTGDQHDAFSIAASLWRADRDGRLAAFLNPELSPPERSLAQVEGWILGVPGLIRSDKGRDDSHTPNACDPNMFRLH